MPVGAEAFALLREINDAVDSIPIRGQTTYDKIHYIMVLLKDLEDELKGE